MERFDTVVLAGGLGTRLRGEVSDLPKVLAPINGTPFLDILLNYLNKWDCVGNVIIAVGYMADKVIERYNNSTEYNYEILFSVEEKPLGTGGAIKKALQCVKTGDFLVLNGDSYTDLCLNAFMKKHIEKNAMMTVVLVEVDNASRYGKVKLDKENKIVFFEEKNSESSKRYINAGVYLIKKSLFGEVKENKVLSLEKELMPVFLDKDVYGYVSYGKFFDIGTPETYKAADMYLKEFC